MTEPAEQQRVEATLRRSQAAEAAAKRETEAAKAEADRLKREQAAPAAPAPAAAPDPERQAAAEAGMSPERFASLAGKTSLSDWEAGRANGA